MYVCAKISPISDVGMRSVGIIVEVGMAWDAIIVEVGSTWWEEALAEVGAAAAKNNKKNCMINWTSKYALNQPLIHSQVAEAHAMAEKHVSEVFTVIHYV